MITSFVQLSDLHISSRNNADENTALRTIVEGLISEFSTVNKPTVLLTGDIVDDGTEDQYTNAVTILKPLKEAGFKLLACPGNHDYGPKGNIYTDNAQNRFQQFMLRDLLGRPEADTSTNIMENLYPVVDIIDDCFFLGIDTVVDAEDDFAHFAAGEVGVKQRESIKAILKQVPDNQPVIAYMHHHPFYRMVGMQMKDAQETMELLGSKTNVLLFGHKHVPEVWLDRANINWIIAADKTTRIQATGMYHVNYVKVYSQEDYSISTLKFDA